MKRTQFKDALKTVRKRIVSFISIVLVIALGTALFLVCRLGYKTTTEAGNNYFKRTNYRDIELKATRGMSKEDVDAVKELDFVLDAEGIVSTTLVVRTGDSRVSATVLSKTENIDKYEIIEGKDTENDDECVISGDLADFTGAKVGDTVELTGEDRSLRLVKTRTLKVAGIMNHPVKFRNKELMGPIVVMQKGAFDTETVGVEYTGIVVRVKSDANAFSSNYKSQMQKYGNTLTLFGKERAQIRDDEIAEIAQGKISEAEALLADAAALLADARKEIEAGETELSVASAMINMAHTAIDYYESNLKSIEERLGVSSEVILGIIGGAVITSDVFTKIDDMDLIMRAVDEYSQIVGNLETVKETLAEKVVEYEAGIVKINEARKELEAKQAEYDEGVAELEAAKKDFADAEKDKWIVLTRFQNPSFIEMYGVVGTFSNIGSTFAVMFMLLGALVCYATIGKIIDEQRKLVGTTKAIGFTRAEIFKKYLLFGVSGSAFGALFGSILSVTALQPIMIYATEISYVIGKFNYQTDVLTSLIAIAAAGLVGAAAAYFACGKLLKKPAIRLLNGDVKGTANKVKVLEDGKRPRSLYAGLTLRNMRDDIKRVLITVASIAGCMVLLIVGFSIKLSFDEVVNNQFVRTQRYDSTVSFIPDVGGKAEASIGAILEKNADSEMPMYQLGTVMRIGDEAQACQIVCADPDELVNFCSLYDITKKKNIRIPDGGIVIFSRLAEVYHLTIGDNISIMSPKGEYCDVTVSGIYNNSTGRTMYMSASYAKAIFGESCVPNAYAVKHGSGSLETLKTELAKDDSFVEIMTANEIQRKARNASKTMNAVVITMIVMSAIMAGVVLMNLIRIQINQKRRELTVMRINGFTIRETAGYIIKENIITTIAGIVIGVFAGASVAWFNLRSIERVDLQMSRGVSIPACIYSALITVLFAVIINWIVLRTIKKLDLTKIDD
ncbi:MAG: FtsX-like permease family protein [Clostridia bacterium]|nr:FtsX-like permease family protein [Clostridia bacterium]